MDDPLPVKDSSDGWGDWGDANQDPLQNDKPAAEEAQKQTPPSKPAQSKVH